MPRRASASKPSPASWRLSVTRSRVWRAAARRRRWRSRSRRAPPSGSIAWRSLVCDVVVDDPEGPV
eukprot:11181580-Lingulodinium_polyedra.AAC.1